MSTVNMVNELAIPHKDTDSYVFFLKKYVVTKPQTRLRSNERYQCRELLPYSTTAPLSMGCITTLFLF